MNVGEQLQERLNRMPPDQGRAWEERFIKELDEQAAANDYPADVSKTVPEHRPFRVKKRDGGAFPKAPSTSPMTSTIRCRMPSGLASDGT